MSDVEKYTARYLVSIGEGKTGVVTHDVYAALASRHERALALLREAPIDVDPRWFARVVEFLKGEAGNE